MVAAMPPQQQAERLLQYAISRHMGATDEIKARVKGWLGRITRTPSLDTLLEVASNGDDLRVRAAAIEIELAALNVAKTSEQVDALLRQIAPNPTRRPAGSRRLGLLANRGVETARIHERASRPDARTGRRRPAPAVEAIAFIGTDETVPRPARRVSSRSRVHRPDPGRRLRPRPLRHADARPAHAGRSRADRDGRGPKLDPETVKYAYRALREITDHTLPDAAQPWRDWYAAHGAEATEKFRKMPDGKF